MASILWFHLTQTQFRYIVKVSVQIRATILDAYEMVLLLSHRVVTTTVRLGALRVKHASGIRIGKFDECMKHKYALQYFYARSMTDTTQ